MITTRPNHPPTTQRSVEEQVHRTVQRRLTESPYAFVFGKVAYHVADGRLTLRGSVSSFYLKQVLQELLRDIDDVAQIYNEVDVVSVTGLSSVRAKKPDRECRG